MHELPAKDEQMESASADASVARLIAIILSAGLVWATAVTLVAWVLGRVIARG
jgi:hypothetical protein